MFNNFKKKLNRKDLDELDKYIFYYTSSGLQENIRTLENKLREINFKVQSSGHISKDEFHKIYLS